MKRCGAKHPTKRGWACHRDVAHFSFVSQHGTYHHLYSPVRHWVRDVSIALSVMVVGLLATFFSWMEPSSSITTYTITPDGCEVCTTVCWGGTGTVCWEYCRTNTNPEAHAPGC